MHIVHRHISDWAGLLKEFERTRRGQQNWIFRGQSDAKWGLASTLERVRKTRGIPRRDLLHTEGGLIRRFKRQYHHYSSDPPNEWDYLEWLALMQHHGAPTRLLDWTYSF